MKGEGKVNPFHVLLVDDEIYSIRGVQAGVDWEEHNISAVYTAQNLRQAQEVFLSRKVDLLICDIEMPKGSGLDLLKWVREHYSHTETIFLTCHSDFLYAKQALQLQSFNYLLKPVDYKELEEVIDGALEKIKKAQEIRKLEESYLQLKNSQHSIMTDVTVNQVHSSHEKGSLVDLVKQYISENIGEQRLSREMIANYVFLNPDYLTRLFKKQTGLSISDYLIQQRIEYAKKMLRETNLTITEIALSVGYSNFPHFSTIFKKMTKHNPKEYRKLSREMEKSE